MRHRKKLDIADLQRAGDEMLADVLRLARHHKLCPVCLLNTVTDAVNMAVDAGEIEHGIPGIDYVVEEQLQ